MRRKGGLGMSEWKKVKLGEVCDTQYGFTASTVQQDTGTQFLRITDIVPQLIDWNTVPYCQIQEKDREKYLLHKGDIVVARTGATVGYAKYIKEDVPAVFASYLVRLLVNSIDVDRHYVGLCVESNLFKEYIQSISNGSAQPNANAQMISSFEINLPPLSTQHRIATILSRYDSLIENYQKQIKLLEEAAQRLYKEWFVDLRFPGHENTNIIDGVPEGWTPSQLGQLAEFKRGKTITKKDVIDGDIPVVAGGLEPAYYCNKSNTAERVITISGSGANAGFTRMYFEKVWASDCSFVDASVTPFLHFVYCFLKNNKTTIDNLQKGAAQPHVYAKDINSLSICIPIESVLKSFEEKVSNYFDTTASLQSQLRLLTEARDRLLPKLTNEEMEI